jgi:hypothetical protein
MEGVSVGLCSFLREFAKYSGAMSAPKGWGCKSSNSCNWVPKRCSTGIAANLPDRVSSNERVRGPVCWRFFRLAEAVPLADGGLNQWLTGAWQNASTADVAVEGTIGDREMQSTGASVVCFVDNKMTEFAILVRVPLRRSSSFPAQLCCGIDFPATCAQLWHMDQLDRCSDDWVLLFVDGSSRTNVT